MKRIGINSIWIGAMLLMTSAQSPIADTPQHAATSDSISITAEIWCPYACEPEAEKPGILVEIVKEIFEHEGISASYTLMPWRRALMETERGGSDAILGVVEGNRGDLLLDKYGMGVDETVIVMRKDADFSFNGPRSLDSLRLGVITDYTYDNNGELDSYLQMRLRAQDRIVTIYRDEPIKSLTNMLTGNRIDAFLENRQVTNYEASRLNFKDQIRIIGTGLGDTIHVGFTPNELGRNYLELYNRGLTRLLKSGRVAEIFLKYGLKSVPTKIEFEPADPADSQASNQYVLSSEKT